MIKKIDSNKARLKRHRRVRAKISGTPQRPRLNVFRSTKHIYAQVIDDVNGVTLASASSMDKRNIRVGAEVAYLPRSKSLYARLEIRSRSAIASCVSAICCRREDNSSERSSASSAGYGFILKTSIVYNQSTMEILCRNEARFHEAHFVLTVQIL